MNKRRIFVLAIASVLLFAQMNAVVFVTAERNEEVVLKDNDDKELLKFCGSGVVDLSTYSLEEMFTLEVKNDEKLFYLEHNSDQDLCFYVPSSKELFHWTTLDSLGTVFDNLSKYELDCLSGGLGGKSRPTCKESYEKVDVNVMIALAMYDLCTSRIYEKKLMGIIYRIR